MRIPRPLPLLLAGILACLTVTGARPSHAYAYPTAFESNDISTAALVRDAGGLHGAINVERVSNGVPPLQVDERLTEVAAMRSRDQAARHYLSHVNPDGETIFGLLDAAGIPWTAAGENLAETGAVIPWQAAMDGFMHSPPHRANVLDREYGRVGIGEAVADDGSVILTVVFTN